MTAANPRVLRRRLPTRSSDEDMPFLLLFQDLFDDMQGGVSAATQR
jgi:hypothetical protein